MNAVILDRLIRIGIADDNKLVRETLRLMLDCSPNIQVVGEAENGSEAIAKECSSAPLKVVGHPPH